MTAKKIFIALFLTFSYSLGLGHNVVPHCHDVLSGDLLLGEHDHQHDHDHHQHTDQSEADSHDHVLHGDHFDDNLLDLLICYVSDDLHDADACFTDQDQSPEQNQKNNNSYNFYPANLSYIGGINGVFYQEISIVFLTNRETYASYEEYGWPCLRGPPTA